MSTYETTFQKVAVLYFIVNTSEPVRFITASVDHISENIFLTVWNFLVHESFAVK